MEADYVITVVNDAEIPLAASAGGGQPYFSLMVVFVCAVALLMGILLYYVKCSKYRERYYNLCGVMGRTEEAGWSLRKLKEAVMEMENEQVSIILEKAWQN